MSPRECLESVQTVLVIDWPSRDVPESLARAGFRVIVRGGPGPQDYSTWEVGEGAVVVRTTGIAPKRADLVYAHRPLTELPQIIATARDLQAKAIWAQSGLAARGEKDPKGCWVAANEREAARSLAAAAGLTYFTEPYIADAARELQTSRLHHFDHGLE